MTNSTNVVQLSGALTQDAVVVNFRDTNRLARFILCVNKLIKSDTKGAHWIGTDFNIVLYNEVLEKVLDQLTKGVNVSLEGSLETFPYTNKHGELVQTIEIVASKIDIQ